MRVIIKGTPEQARDAATVRGIFIRTTYKSTENETIAIVSDEFWIKVADWFHEAPYHAPFPIGTCLHYQHDRPIHYSSSEDDR